MSENGPYSHNSAQPVVVVPDTWLLIGGAQWKECRTKAFGCRFVHSVEAESCFVFFCFFYKIRKRGIASHLWPLFTQKVQQSVISQFKNLSFRSECIHILLKELHNY